MFSVCLKLFEDLCLCNFIMILSSNWWIMCTPSLCLFELDICASVNYKFIIL
uniref:Uncharacterized protein n=1 Tax=Solanum lycopersicum TaxID=4081 RepID=K4D0Y6_SOLLC